MVWGGGGEGWDFINVTVYLKLYARPVAVKLEEMYLNFFLHDRHKFMPPSVWGVWAVIPRVINFLQTVLWSAAISSRGQFYRLESSSCYW